MRTSTLGNALALFALCLVACISKAGAADVTVGERVAEAPKEAAAAVYVDGRAGNDASPGTKEAPVRSIGRAAEMIRSRGNGIYVMRLNPGIHVLERHVALATEKDATDRSIVVEASVLPDDPVWTPAQMPIVINSSGLGEIPEDAASYVVSFLVEANHVTIRGIKFHGYFNPNSRYFPVARLDKSKTDLRVEQCLFLGAPQAAHLQVGVIAHGNGVKIDHCVFYGARNAAVFWQDSGGGSKSGNEFTHSIVVGATQCAVWTAWPDHDFVFSDNIVSGCQYVWIKNAANSASYSMTDCIVVANEHLTGVCQDDGVRPEAFALAENNVIKAGNISLRLVDDLDKPLPRDYLHPVPGSLGYGFGAGLFER